MVHVSAGADEPHILDRLRADDILTHCFHGRSNNMIAAGGESFIPNVRAARDHKIEPALVVREGTIIAPGDIPLVLRKLYEADRVVFVRTEASCQTARFAANPESPT